MGAVADVLEELRSWRRLASVPRRLAIRNRPADKEVPDPVPLAIPVGYETPPTMQEMIQQYVREELSVQAEADGLGTFEEEDDFELDDEEQMPLSGFEVTEYELVPEEAEPDASPPEGPPVVDEEPSDDGPPGASTPPVDGSPSSGGVEPTADSQ